MILHALAQPSADDPYGAERRQLSTALSRVQDLYTWGDITSEGEVRE
jgi:hypothetical protein